MASIPGMPITLLPATEQLSLLRRHAISPLELAEEHITQIRRLNPQLNALVDFDAERVRAHAARVRPGPLSGLPVTLKSSISVAGYRCEIGSILNRGYVPEKNAAVVERLIGAGAVVLGTTNCPEFLMAYETENLLYGSTRNPWNLDYSAGGSSGGEWTGQRQRRFSTRAGALHGHLRAQADGGPLSGSGTSAAVPRAVFVPGIDWPDGADSPRPRAAS
jgi:hypothetical protein